MMTACDAVGTNQGELHRFHLQAQCKHPRATIDRGKAEVAAQTDQGTAQVLKLVEDLPISLEAHAKKDAEKLAFLKRTDAHPIPDEDVTTAIPAKVDLLNFVYAFSIN